MAAILCSRCKSPSSLRLARSRVRVDRGTETNVEIVTKTYYCPLCSSFTLDHEQKQAQPARAACLRQAVAALTLVLLMACSTVPITERRQLDLIPSGTMLPMSFNSYRDFLSKSKVVEGTPEAEMVQRVGSRIQQAVERYYAENNLSKELKDYAWEFRLVENKEQNAWAMPGGKVAVYSGILPVTGDEAGLAVVMGHEIAHAVAKHGDERMSQGLIAQMGGIALSVALAEKPAETQQLFMTAYGAGAQVGVLLPFSRLQESEADHLGLIFMAMAGYDPQAAVGFWQRMNQAHEGSAAPPELLSTHPADKKRIEKIQELIPEVMKYYRT